MTERATLGERLLAAREKKRLSQDTLAEQIGAAGRRTIIRWEKDEYVPEPKFQKELAKALNLPDGFFGEKERPRRGRRSIDHRLAAVEEAVARLEQRLFGADESPTP